MAITNKAGGSAIDKMTDGTALRVQDHFYLFLEQFQLPSSFSSNTAIYDNGSTSGLTSTLLSESHRGGGVSNDLVSSSLAETGTTVAQGRPVGGLPYYRRQLFGMQHDGSNTLFIDFSHIYQESEMLASIILEGYYRFEPYLRKALTAFAEKYIPDYVLIPNTHSRREFWVSFYGLSLVHRLRELTTTKIGQLITISGTVTRTSEVRPELYLGTFQCNMCRAIVRDVEQQFRYTEPNICFNPLCNNRNNWTLLMESSAFLDWQRVRIQENSHEIPAGSMPRSMDVIVRNELVERAKAGDKCDFTGCLIVVPDVSQLALPGGKLEAKAEGGRPQEGFSGSGVTGLKALGVRELGYKLAFMACMVTPTEARSGAIHFRGEEGLDNEQSVEEMFSAEERERILKMKMTPNLYTRLVESVAPSIFGHQDIKAGILLMLFGGLHKVTAEGINLRGDINVCIVGDPGTAKSQFLKYVTGFLPRSVYTSGKSSSAAGLTASVVKDEETGEFTIEAGALMLADNGICAIDEFDKMDISDQVAIHEAMEQQTISIAKAGIHATLNARTSILAAANPVHGRYDRKKSLKQNISMSAPIMSRFDLFFVILDDCNETSDYNIARHILSIHRLQDEAMDPEFSADQIQSYIKYARTIKPILTSESAQLLVEKYCQLRQNDLIGYNSSYRMTVRQLESMIRLSEALARLHLDAEVKPKYVREAYRLLKSSVIRVETESIDLLNELDADDPMQSFQEEEPEAEPEFNATTIGNGVEEPGPKPSTKSTLSIKKKLDTNEEIGLNKSVLVEQYLEQIEEEIDSEEELLRRKKEIKAVIERLIHKDCILIELKEDTNDEDPMLVVHPNYQP